MAKLGSHLLPWATVVILLLKTVGAKASHVFEISASGSVDLSGRNLGTDLELTVKSSNAGRVTLNLLNVSGNPNLERIQITGTVQVVQINILDLTGTSVSPIPANNDTEQVQLIRFAQPQNVMLTVFNLFINRTARADRPLEFPDFVDLIYRLRVQSFTLAHWPVARFEANFTQADSKCQSKLFNSAAVRGAGIERLVNGIVSATRGIDLRWNQITQVENVTFNSASVNLGHNRISRLANVTFLPGALCRILITSEPEILLNDNAVTLQALDALAAASNSEKPSLLRGLDLSRNPLISRITRQQDPLKASSRLGRIGIGEWLHLDSVAGDDVEASVVERGLTDLLNRFEALKPIGLDLSGNRLESLSAVSRILASRWPVRYLSLARSAFTDPNLNLSELASIQARSVDTELRFGDLTGSPARSLSLTVGRAVALNATILGDFDRLIQVVWSSSSRVLVLPQPTGCCRGHGETTEVLCFLRAEMEDDEGLQARRRLFCRNESHLGAGTSELPSSLLIFLCLAAALLTAIAIVTGGVLCAVRWRRRRLRRRRRARRNRWTFQRPPPASGFLEGGQNCHLQQHLKLGEKPALPGAVEGD